MVTIQRPPERTLAKWKKLFRFWDRRVIVGDAMLHESVLFRRYADEREQAAFAVIPRRRIWLVYPPSRGTTARGAETQKVTVLVQT
jgi:hypothetical protein